MPVLKVKKNGVWEVVGGGSGGSSLDIPTFDLNEMGMPVIDVTASKELSVENVDCTQIREALENGLVKINFEVDPSYYSSAYTKQTSTISQIVTGFYETDYDYYQIVVNSMFTPSKYYSHCYNFLFRIYQDKIEACLYNGYDVASYDSLAEVDGYDTRINIGEGKFVFYPYYYDGKYYEVFIPSIGDYTSKFYNIQIDKNLSDIYYSRIRLLTAASGRNNEIETIAHAFVPFGKTDDVGKILVWKGEESTTGFGYDLVPMPEGGSNTIEIPAPTESDYGKVLTYTANGLAWVTPVGGSVPSAEGVEF